MNEQVMWLAPRALNETVGSAPAVLGFRTDDFMNDLETALASEVGLSGLEARPETWRDDRAGDFPAPTEPAPVDPVPPTKLYQPVHGRYYLVAAHLVCRRYGHPDRRMSGTETAGFVVRRMVGNAEYAWVIVDGTGRWIEQADPGRFAADEDLLPMAPTAHMYRARRTRLLTGLVPVGAREKYEARSLTTSAVADPTSGSDDATAVQMALRETVVAPLLQLINATTLDPDAMSSEEVETLELALVDLVDWLTATNIDLAGAFAAHSPTLDFATLDAFPGTTWQEALDDIATNRSGVLNGTYQTLVAKTSSRVDVDDLLRGDPLGATIDDATMPTDTVLVQAVEAQLGDITDIGTGAENETVTLETDGPGEYVFRTVYRRTDCVHERAAWVSPPTARFRFAGFFDPDAPARPVQISLPFDTSPKGLRQFPRNVKVLLSESMQKQMSRIDDEFVVKDGLKFDLGMVCALSIPIITICALILLMIMVSILNLIFWWLPFFKICIPKVTVKSE